MKNNSKNKNVNAKKKNDNNKKGFTLIELLAVIVIMAVLMITAIPAITTAIARSRRDTFATNAKKIIDAVRTGMVDNEFVSTNSGDGNICQLPGPGQYVEVQLVKGNDNSIEKLLERGGSSSSFGKNYKSGRVWIVNKGTAAADDSSDSTDNFEYYISLVDSGNNGSGPAILEKNISRGKIKVGSAGEESKPTPSGGIGTVADICKYEE